MKTTTIVLALSLAFLAACDRDAERRPAGAGGSAAPANTANTDAPTRQSPANLGTPNAAEKAEGRNPQQGQVDPKQSEQHRDFKHPQTGGK
jgi:hypothetical protein